MLIHSSPLQTSPPSPIYGFIHIGIMNDYLQIFKDQLISLKKHQLSEATSCIFIGSSGRVSAQQINEIEFLLKQILGNTKFDYAIKNQVLEVGENETINFLHQKSKELHDSKFWYIHTKGASYHFKHKRKKACYYWRKYMEFFIIENWKKCVEALDNHDVCGVQWCETSQLNKKHFSGNFWWATTNYLMSLTGVNDIKINKTNRYKAEAFIGTNNPKVKNFMHVCAKKNFYNDLIYSFKYKNQLL